VRPRDDFFYDVPVEYWAYLEIKACVDAGIVQGYPDSFYRPARPVTRAEMAVYIARALEGSDALVPELTGPTRFPDVQMDYWAARHIEYAAEARIVGGYADGLYHGDWTITRAQMSVFIARSMVIPTGDEGLAGYEPPDTPSFTDVPTYHWAYRHIEYLVESGATDGYPDRFYRPTATCTRDQMAVYLARAFGLVEQP
jgi:hypothetical protein